MIATLTVTVSKISSKVYIVKESNSTKNFHLGKFLDRLEHLVETRLEGKWRELSKKSGVSEGNLSKIRNGQEPKMTTLSKIANALEVSNDWLIDGKEPKPTNGKIQKMIELMDNLNETQQREILLVIQEKKRMNELEEIILSMQKKRA